MKSLPTLGQGFSFYEYYSPEVYGPEGESGHPQNWATELDDNGYLHFGNGSGVLTFNGVDWHANHVGESGRVVSIFNSGNGQVYANGSTNFGKIVPDSLNRVTYASISDQFFGPNDSQPYIWETYEIGEYLYHRHNAGMTKYHAGRNSLSDYPLNGESLSFSSFRMGDSIIVDAESGLWAFKDSLYHEIPNSEIFKDQILQFGLKWNDDTYLLGSRNVGQAYRESNLWLFNGKAVIRFISEADEYLKQNFLYDAIRVDDQVIAIATIYGGVVFINNEGELLKIFTERIGLHTNSVYNLFLDHENMLWMGLAEGIQKLHLNNKVIQYSENSGIKGSIGDIMVSGDDVYVYAFPSIYTNILLEPENVQSFREIDFNGQFGGFVNWENEAYVYGETGIYRLYKFRGHEQLYDEPILEYVHPTTNDSTLTFIGPDNLIHFNGTKFRVEPIQFNQEIGSAVKYENDIYLTLGGRTGAKEIARITEGRLSLIPVNYDTSNVVTFIEMGIINDKLYLGAEGGGNNSGLYEWDKEQQEFYKSKFMEEHPDFNGKQIFNLQQCNNSETWFTANKNLYKVIEEDGKWEAKASPYQLVGKNTIYDIECADDGVWMGGTNNLFFISNDDWDYQTSFKTNITGIYVDGDSLIYGGFKEPIEPIILPYEDNELRFTYAAASYISPENNSYQVKLEGFDENWSTWNFETQKDYTNIPEGLYIFRVRSQNIYEVAGITDSIEFEILPPWYRTWWAYLLYTIAFTGILYVIYRIRIKQILRVQRIRNNIASDLHDEVSATLSSISYFAQAIKSDNMKGDKNRFVDLIANSAGDAKEKITDIVWAINPEHDDWQGFLSKCRRHASDLLESKNMNYSLKIDEYIPGKLDMQLRQHLWLIYKEMITNAVRHSGADQLDVILKYEDGKLILVVQDDGTGMDIDHVKKGNGLVNIHKRADAIGADITLKTSEGYGTRWKLKLSL